MNHTERHKDFLPEAEAHLRELLREAKEIIELTIDASLNNLCSTSKAIDWLKKVEEK